MPYVGKHVWAGSTLTHNGEESKAFGRPMTYVLKGLTNMCTLPQKFGFYGPMKTRMFGRVFLQGYPNCVCNSEKVETLAALVP